MSITRNEHDVIIFHCDTPNCKARTEPLTMFHESSAKKARQQGWAIGTTDDACPKHHV